MGTDSNADVSGRRRRWWTGAYVVAVAVGVVLALMVHRRRVDPVEAPIDVGRRVPTPRPATRPSELLAPLKLRRIDAAPADLPMPTGATRLSLIARDVFGAEQIKAEYRMEGALAPASDAMVEAATEAGWRRLPGTSTACSVSSSRLNFSAGGDLLTVHLNAEGEYVMISAVIQRSVRR